MPDEINPNETAAVETTEAATPDVPETPAPPADPDDAALDAFSEGVESEREEPPADTAPKGEDAEGGDPATPAAETDEDGKPKEPTTDAAKVDEPDPEVEKEIEGFELKDKAAARFREMAGTIKSNAQAMETLERDASRGMEWERVVLDSTATPDQFSAAMSVLKGANSGNASLKNQAFDAMVNMLQEMGKDLGRDVPGLVDPLAEHQDLSEAVNAGDMSRQQAVEVAQARALRASSEQQSANQQREWQAKQATETATQQVQTLAEQLRAQDPDFDRKLAYLKPAIAAIQQGTAPQHWAAAIAQAYRDLPALPPMVSAPPPAKPPVSGSPLRAGIPSRGMTREPKSDMEAFEMGAASVRP